MLLNASDVSLLLIDVQEKLFAKIHNNQLILKNIFITLESFSRLDLPILYTEQYPKGLGPTLPELTNYLEKSQMHTKRIEKTTFSCFPPKDDDSKVKSIKTQQVLIAGIETHICVLQTAIDLKNSNFEVFILEDCVGSRDENTKCLALERARNVGISIVNIEMAIFELLRDSKHENFRDLSSLIK